MFARDNSKIKIFILMIKILFNDGLYVKLSATKRSLDAI